MDLIEASDYADLSSRAADIVERTVRAVPDASLVLATGATPMKLYADLVERRTATDYARVRVFQLDDYLNISRDDPRSLYRWMRQAVLEPLNISDQRVTSLDGGEADAPKRCSDYEAAVERAGGIELSILGLGPNGHLGFNEPPSGPDERTRVVRLAEASIQSNAAYWGGRDRVPTLAITAGMRVLLHARRTLLLVSGENKRSILQRVLNGPIGPHVPASYLRQTGGVCLIADRAALGGSAT